MPRFVTKKWVKVVDDQSGSAVDRYKPSIQIRFKTSMLRSDLFDFSDAYIVVNGTITVTGTSIRVEQIDLWHLKIMHHLLLALIRSSIIQKT